MLGSWTQLVPYVSSFLAHPPPSLTVEQENRRSEARDDKPRKHEHKYFLHVGPARHSSDRNEDDCCRREGANDPGRNPFTLPDGLAARSDDP